MERDEVNSACLHLLLMLMLVLVLVPMPMEKLDLCKSLLFRHVAL